MQAYYIERLYLNSVRIGDIYLPIVARAKIIQLNSKGSASLAERSKIHGALSLESLVSCPSTLAY